MSPYFSQQPSRLHVRLILLVAGSMLPLLTLIGAIVYQSYETTRVAAGDRLLQTTRSAIAMVDRELQNQIAALQVLALSPALHAGDFAGFRGEAERFANRFPAATAVSVSDASGQQLFNTAVVNDALPRRGSMEPVERVFATGKPYVSNIYIGAVSHQPTFTVDVPVMQGDMVKYDLAFNAPRAMYYELLERLNLPQDWILSIFDRHAHHIARLPPLSKTEITSAAKSLQVELAKGDEGLAETVSVEGTPLLSAFTRSVETGWVVAIGTPAETLTTPARRALLATFSIGAAFMVIGFVFAARLATQLARAEGHRELLINELNHRVKNTLSAVQGIVYRGLQDSPATAETRKKIEARIMALSRAHNILSSSKWESAELHDIAASILDPYRGQGGARIDMRGERVTLKPRVTIPLAMVLHELVTNAAKYGALTAATGVIELSWTLIDPGRLRMEWREMGGPPVQTPDRIGFGTKFIERAVSGELGGSYSCSYRTEGFTCVFDIVM